MPAGRLGPGWLLVREEAAMAAPVPAIKGAVWDGRFRLLNDLPAGTMIGALGADASRFRRQSTLPAAVLRTLPALRRGNSLAAVPHLLYRAEAFDVDPRLIYHPPVPLAAAAFLSG